MPPAKKRARRYDSAKIRAAVTAQFGHVREAVAGLTPEQLALPSGLGEWSVRELAAHMCMGVEFVNRAIEQDGHGQGQGHGQGHAGPDGDLPAVTVTLAAWPLATAAHAGAISEDVEAYAASAPAEELFARTAARLDALLPGADDDQVPVIRLGPMRFGDFLVTRTVELIVHTDDLNRATGLAVPFDRQALAACTRVLADALATKAPGASTEVRVPPYAVVQCVAGPRHTRGTPPNVVETDPLTWIRLATGRTGWREEVEAARVGASGERADLGGLLPLMG
ncbi:sterol carrier family protein [Streptomyces sp. JV176]|uniref:maleylpyruvate isomerase family mycothiol-dependent enzyme n=1 Tax=Streptomyces sp. JV176 TaxID=858630 RepID=UPI002E762A8A|nr:sterol carrier family protein [Streptomyces sp. JV176]MEE1802928.1 sterol carrier family protein [Streptomyces sp. JV176]